MNDVEKVKLDGLSLNRISSTKFLGVLIDENLTWENHTEAISKNISKNTGVLTKLKHFVPENILYTLYCTLILPYINYGVFILGNTSIRTISNSHFRSHTGPLFSKFNILNVYDTFKLNLGIFMYKHQKNQLPPICVTYFTKHVQAKITPQEMPKIIVLI